MKKFLIFLYPIIAILFATFAWVAGNNDPVPSSHALTYLIHSSGWWYVPVLVATVVFLIITVAGTIGLWFAVITRTWIWIISILLVFATVGSFAATRRSAGHDPNVSARYQAFAITQGWDK